MLARAAAADVFVAAAAVADWTPAVPADRKLKKHEGAPRLELAATPDILAAVAALPRAPFTVGFAAETADLEANARAKLDRKGVDLVAANDVGGGAVFDADDNELLVLWRGGERRLARAPKPALARALVALIAERFGQR